jgi:hypothetical protein
LIGTTYFFKRAVWKNLEIPTGFQKQAKPPLILADIPFGVGGFLIGFRGCWEKPSGGWVFSVPEPIAGRFRPPNGAVSAGLWSTWRFRDLLVVGFPTGGVPYFGWVVYILQGYPKKSRC